MTTDEQAPVRDYSCPFCASKDRREYHFPDCTRNDPVPAPEETVETTEGRSWGAGYSGVRVRSTRKPPAPAPEPAGEAEEHPMSETDRAIEADLDRWAAPSSGTPGLTEWNLPQSLRDTLEEYGDSPMTWAAIEQAIAEARAPLEARIAELELILETTLAAWKPRAEDAERQLEEMWERWGRILEAARTAIQNLADCTHDCNDRGRAGSRLDEIATIAERALTPPASTAQGDEDD